MRGPRAIARLLPILAVCLACCGLVRTVHQTYYYSLWLDLPRPAAPPAPGQPARPLLVLNPLVVRDPYAQERMVYRSSHYQVHFYNYQLWASPPAEQLTDWTLRYLRATGLFGRVLTSQLGAGPDALVLSGVVRHMEEIDQGDLWQAALAIDFSLSRGDQDTPIWTHSYEAIHNAARRNPEAVAAAMSRDLEQILAELTRDLQHIDAAALPMRN